MRASRQLLEHGDTVGAISGLAEYDVVENHCRIGREHGQSLATTPNRECLFAGQADYVFARVLFRASRFVDVRPDYRVRDADLRKQLTTPR
jgi:hypothetical protein